MRWLVALALLWPVTTEAAWYDRAWSYRKAITIDGTLVAGGPHASFPLLILFTDADLDAAAQIDGGDLWLTAADGSTPVDFEVEEYDSGTVVAWVRIPSITSGTDVQLYLYYGNPSPPAPPPASNVWESSYLAVWHMNQDPDVSQVLDSTANANHGTAEASMTSNNRVAGQIGGSLYFDGVDDYIEVPSPAGGVLDITAGDITLEAWVRPIAAPPSEQRAIIAKDDWTEDCAGNNDAVRNYALITQTTDELGFGVNEGTSVMTARNYVTSGGPLTVDAWQHVVAVNTFGDGSSTRIYWNGTEPSAGWLLSDGDLFPNSSNDIPVQIAAAGCGTKLFEVVIDEVRISSAIRSTEWIQTQMVNHTAPGVGGFIRTLGPEQECEADGDCDDGDACTGTETCSGGRCQTGTSVDCDDDVACTVDSCNSITGACAHAPNDTACDNGRYCDGAETCDSISGCQAGTAVVCPDDGDICTSAVCSDSTDSCETSTRSECCTADADCATGSVCIVGDCDESANTCGYVFPEDCCTSDDDCDDGNPCTDTACAAGDGRCSRTWITGCCLSDVDCDDGDPCTLDECVASRRCQHQPLGCASPGPCGTDTWCVASAVHIARGANSPSNSSLAGDSTPVLQLRISVDAIGGTVGDLLLDLVPETGYEEQLRARSLQLELHLDADGEGTLDPGSAALATAVSDGNRVAFADINWPVEAATEYHVLVTAAPVSTSLGGTSLLGLLVLAWVLRRARREQRSALSLMRLVVAIACIVHIACARSGYTLAPEDFETHLLVTDNDSLNVATGPNERIWVTGAPVESHPFRVPD